MPWIKYQIEQGTNEEGVILLTKKVGYTKANLAIAQAEAYEGVYEIVADGEAIEKLPVVPTITFGPESDGYPSNPVEGQIHVFYEE